MKKYLFKNKSQLFLCVILQLIESFLFATTSLYLKIILDTAAEKNFEKIKDLIIYGICFTLIFALIHYSCRYERAKYLQYSVRDFRQDVFTSILKKNLTDFYKNNTASYISELNNDVGMLEDDYFDNFMLLIRDSVMIVFSSIFMIIMNPLLGTISVGLSFLPLLVPKLYSLKIATLKENYSKSLELYNKRIKDIFSGFEVIKSFRIEKNIQINHLESNKEVVHQKFLSNRQEGVVEAVNRIFSFSIQFGLFLGAAVLVILGKITIGAVVAIVQLNGTIMSCIFSYVDEKNKWNSVKNIKNKMSSILQTEEHIDSPGKVCGNFQNKIEVENLFFSFDGTREVLNNINLSFCRKKKYAIVGNSGSGKSTLLRLLLRYYDNYEGKILIDGVDSREITTESLYDLCSIIHQNVFLFDDTLRNNITLYNDYSDDEVKQAAHGAGLNEVIEKLPDGLDSRVDENGGNFSGGEKQRVAIARALIKKTPVLILDEATSSLDNETAYKIENSLLDVPDLTCLVVTHRYNRSLLQRYDQIIALKDGQVAETGTFDELMGKKDYFFSLYTIAN